MNFAKPVQAALLTLGFLSLAGPAGAQINCGPIDFDLRTTSAVTLSGGVQMVVGHVSDEYKACGVIFSSNGLVASAATVAPQLGGGSADVVCVGSVASGGLVLPDATQPITLTHQYLGVPTSTDFVQLEALSTGGLATATAFDINGAPVTSATGNGFLSLWNSNPVIHRVVVTPPVGGTVKIDDVWFGSCPPFLGVNRCPGSGNVTLTRNATCPLIAGSLDLFLENGPPLSVASLYFSSTLVAPMSSSCYLLLQNPFGTFTVTFDANGRVIYSFPGGAVGGGVYWAQGVVVDPGTSVGLATTNLLRIN